VSENDDKLFGTLFGDEEKPPAAAPAAPPAPKPQAPAAAKAPVKPAAPPPAPAAPPASADAAADAAHLFQEMMAGQRADDAARLAAKKAAAAAKPPPDVEPLVPIRPPVTEEKPASAFAESLAPWTLFKGVATIAMLVYIAGFHGRLLKDAWPTLAVVTLAAAVLVLAVDFVRAAASAKRDEPKAPAKR
jgi:hypothetical protein